MSAHTPGPWHVGGTFLPDSPDAHCSIWSAAPAGCASGDQVAQYVAPCDANLIAAATDLLAALQGLVATHSDARDSGPIVEGEIDAIVAWKQRWDAAFARARAAIAKATP